MMLPLIVFAALLTGCNSKKVIDESQYVAGNTQEQIDRAHTLIDKNNYKEFIGKII